MIFGSSLRRGQAVEVLGTTVTPKSCAPVSDTLEIGVLGKVEVMAVELEYKGVEKGTKIYG